MRFKYTTIYFIWWFLLGFNIKGLSIFIVADIPRSRQFVIGACPVKLKNIFHWGVAKQKVLNKKISLKRHTLYKSARAEF